jgi:hypothetical protein
MRTAAFHVRFRGQSGHRRVSLIRKRAILGAVEASNERAAEAAAVVEFDLSDE